MAADWRQSDTPHYQADETGIPFAPDYGYDRKPTPIDPAEWNHLCTARFGNARPTGWNGRTHWTGDSYRYDIYDRVDSIGTRHLAMRWYNGGGQGWLLTEDRAKSGEANMLDLIVSITDEARRWDYCHFLWQTAHKSNLYGSREAEKEIKLAYVEGRLRKRKVKGAYTVIVQSEVREHCK